MILNSNKKLFFSLLGLSALISFIITQLSNSKLESLYTTSKDWRLANGTVQKCSDTCTGGIRGCAYEAIKLQYSWLNHQGQLHFSEEIIGHQKCEKWPEGSRIVLRQGRNEDGTISAMSELKWNSLQIFRTKD